jgi:hypothetical protein
VCFELGGHTMASRRHRHGGAVPRPLALLVIAALATTGGRAGAAASRVAAAGGDYLPLAVGQRWELRSRAAADPMLLEVTGRDGEAYLVRWVNPFVETTFRFEKHGQDIHLTGLDMGKGLGSIPRDTVYWSFGRRRGEQWSSSVGTQRIREAGQRVTTPSGAYEDTVEIETRDRDGKSMYWTFAPGVGLVRWGEGRDAYLLTSHSLGAGIAVPRTPARPGERPTLPRPRGRSPVLIGVDANPWDGVNEREALQEAFEAGMAIVHVVPTWKDLEPSPGQYQWDGFDLRTGFAAERGLPIALNFRVVDTNDRSLPDAYRKWSFDDERMVEQVRKTIRLLGQRNKARARVVAIGNEVDGYFGKRRGEIAGYARMLSRIRDTVRDEFPGALFTVSFSFGAIGDLDQYRALTDQIDAFSFTYYPLHPDFTVRPPDVVGGDVERMLRAAGTRPVYLQEIGYPSSEVNGSSPERQARFVEDAFEAFDGRGDRLVGATFLFMSDLPRATVDLLGRYYGAGGGAFKAYLQTLGLRERSGTPKPAWDALKRGALALKEAR